MQGEGILSLYSVSLDQHSHQGTDSLPQVGSHHSQIAEGDQSTGHGYPLSMSEGTVK
jgi:hypothetical protein